MSLSSLEAQISKGASDVRHGIPISANIYPPHRMRPMSADAVRAPATVA